MQLEDLKMCFKWHKRNVMGKALHSVPFPTFWDAFCVIGIFWLNFRPKKNGKEFSNVTSVATTNKGIQEHPHAF